MNDILRAADELKNVDDLFEDIDGSRDTECPVGVLADDTAAIREEAEEVEGDVKEFVEEANSTKNEALFVVEAHDGVLVIGLVSGFSLQESAVHAQPVRADIENDHEHEDFGILRPQVAKNHAEDGSGKTIGNHIKDRAETRALVEQAGDVAISRIQKERSHIKRSEDEGLLVKE